MNEAIKMITQSKNIYIFGVGSSGNTSLDLENMFLRVGVQAKALPLCKMVHQVMLDRKQSNLLK
ncbi:hypothetical protein EfmAA96_30970 (plasmid) [Enterococcus faecium]|nr:hypothetical protein EfmAA96_30970 [Enterococcus faecium]